MGFDLVGTGSDDVYYRINTTSWGKMLGLARQHGWDPAGTEPPSPAITPPETYGHDWGGSYGYNGWQMVTRTDAANMAEALERALEHVPQFETEEKRATRVDLGPPNPEVPFLESGVIVDARALGRLRPVHYFSGEEGKRKIEEFVAFCRVGAFIIA